MSPFDLEYSILRPQFDPLVGEIVSRLLMKNKWKYKESDREKDEAEDAQAQIQNYEQWNESLAKKFNVWYKNYIKFRQRFLRDREGNML